MKARQDLDFSQASLADILTHLENLLTEAVSNRHMAFHTPVLLSIGLDGRPRGRTVVVRSFDPSMRRLRCHTDIRSDKAAEIAKDARIGWVFYDPASKWQVRLQGRAVLHHLDDQAQAAWQQSKRMSQICYGTNPAPGTVIGSADQFVLPQEPAEIAAGEAHFSALICTYDEMEALWLGHKGHRRMRYHWSEGGEIHSEWLAP
jgi:pyridoxine/pyridoxamine 5'-phosphate oxidase